MSTRITKGWPTSSKPYPAVPRGDVTFKYPSPTKGEVSVPDPYNALETSPSASATTKKFVDESEATTRAWLDKYEGRDKLRAALTKNWNYERVGVPSRKGQGQGDGYFYYNYNSGLDAQPSIYRVKSSTLAADKTPAEQRSGPGGELFFSPNLLSKAGTTALSSSSFSRDGSLWAYGLSRSGSDWVTIYVRKTTEVHPADGEKGSYEEHDPTHLPDDVLENVKFSGMSWTADGSGFFYQKFKSKAATTGGGKDKDIETGTDENAAVWFHKIGTTQDKDEEVFKDPEHPQYMFGLYPTEDGKYLTLTTSKDTGRNNLLWVAKTPAPGESFANVSWHKVINEWGELWQYESNNNGSFLFYTNADDSSNYKLVSWDFDHPEAGFKDVIPHNPDALLSAIHVTGGGKYLLVLTSKDVRDSLALHDLETGKFIRPVFPELVGSVDAITGRKEDDEFWLGASGFSDPGSTYRYSIQTDELELYRRSNVEGLSPSEFISEQVFYTSKDGTKVPMFVTRHKDVKLDGTAPVLQYSYGGFSHSMTPFFSPAMMTWIKHFRGVLAVPNIRGGEEYGESWHLAGTKERKQNVFDDFQYATKWIHSNGYGAKDKVAISGGSNGGLLVAACLNQAPELFGAVICDVGVLDMLRFQLFTIGRHWTSDYGSADEDGFDYLIKYSPLHNVNPKAVYPPTIVLTSDHDDRVVPAHSFKFMAEVQHQLEKNPNPLLLRVEVAAGHGAGKSTEKKIEEAVDKYGFVAQCWDLTWHP